MNYKTCSHALDGAEENHLRSRASSKSDGSSVPDRRLLCTRNMKQRKLGADLI